MKTLVPSSDRYVVFVAATADTAACHIAVHRENLRAADDPATREEAPAVLQVGDAVTFAFPKTSGNAPLSGKRGVVEALPGGGESPDRYVIFVAATADADQRRLAVKRQHLAFFARAL